MPRVRTEEQIAAGIKRSQSWRDRNPERSRELNADGCRRRRRENPNAVRKDNLRKRYGMTEADVWAMHASQDGVCLVCGREIVPFSGVKATSAVVDHDRETGAVRGLLCHNCNVGLGSFRDRPELLEAGAQYLRDRR